MKQQIRFEYHIWPLVVLMPLINLFTQLVSWRKKRNAGQTVPRYSRFFDGIAALRTIRDGHARWPALDVIYNWRKPEAKGIFAPFESLWLNLRSCQAVRNRYRIVVAAIREEVERHGGQCNILSIACGSAQPVFAAVSGFPGVRVVCVDSDETAIAHGQMLAKRYGVTNVEWHLGNVLSPGSLTNGFTPDIVEVVGLFDYLPDTLIVRLLKRVVGVASADAAILTAHIHPNPEVQFLETVVDWPMTYRSLDQFRELVARSGLTDSQFIQEPHGIFTVAVARKS